MPCQSCKHWFPKSLLYGDCRNTLNEVIFIPFGKETLYDNFHGTLEEFNALSRPSHIPTTSHDYHCTFYEKNDTIVENMEKLE